MLDISNAQNTADSPQPIMLSLQIKIEHWLNRKNFIYQCNRLDMHEREITEASSYKSFMHFDNAVKALYFV